MHAAAREGARAADGDCAPVARRLVREGAAGVVRAVHVDADGEGHDLADGFVRVEQLAREEGVAACGVGIRVRFEVGAYDRADV